MSERSLAHIETITTIDPIEGADKIEVATVLGWQVVVKKGEFKVGYKCVYIEIDSVVPDIPFFEFMRSRKFRIKTIKLRKQLSQGLIVSLGDWMQILKELGRERKTYTFKEGDDITELIGITKYESPSDKESNFVSPSKKKYHPIIKYLTRYQWFRKLFHIKSKSFPEWISKTDETRIQNIPHILKDEANDWYVTEKLDGQSATYWYKHGIFPEFGICSRTVRKSEFDGSNWSKVAKQFGIKKKLKSLTRDYAIQGEILSPKVQGGRYHNNKNSKVTRPFDFYIFNVYDIKDKRYLNLNELVKFCRDLNLKVVPLCSYDHAILKTMDGIILNADGKSILADTLREGVVWRKMDQSVSFKVISNKFLLKE